MRLPVTVCGETFAGSFTRVDHSMKVSVLTSPSAVTN